MTELIVVHEPTGAKVPMVIMQKDPIKYVECLKNRRAFTIEMLTQRWMRDTKDCAELLQAFQVPAYLNRSRMDGGDVDLRNALKAALFFEEYIEAIEEKLQLPKKKVKSRALEVFLTKDEK